MEIGLSKKQRIEPVRRANISNSKLLDVDPQNLNGIQMETMYIDATGEERNSYVPLHQRTPAQKLKMREHTKRHYNMRVTLTLKDPEDSAEQRRCIKEWMQVVYMIDNTFLIYKFEGRTKTNRLPCPINYHRRSPSWNPGL